MDCSTPGLPVHHQLPEFTQTRVHWVSDAIQPSHPLLPPFPLFSNFLNIRVFLKKDWWLKYCIFRFSTSPSNEYSDLISCRIDRFDLFAVQGTLKSLLQYYSLKASILWRSNFFMGQLSHPHMTTGKIIALTRWTFVGKLMCFLICCLGFS